MECSVSRPPITPHYVEYNKHLDQTGTILQRLVSPAVPLTHLSDPPNRELIDTLSRHPVLFEPPSQNKILAKLRILQETARQLLAECLTLRPVEFSLVDPLWSDYGGTWTLERFGESRVPILVILVSWVGSLIQIVSIKSGFVTAFVRGIVISLDPLAAHHALHLFSLQTQLERILHPLTAVTNDKNTTARRPGSKSPTAASSGNTTFDVQKTALEKYRDLMYRNDRQTWRTEWEELVEGEMGGWMSMAGDVDEVGDQQTAGGRSGVSSPGGGAGGKKTRGARGGSVEPPD